MRQNMTLFLSNLHRAQQYKLIEKSMRIEGKYENGKKKQIYS